MILDTIREILQHQPLSTSRIAQLIHVDAYTTKRFLLILKHRRAVDCVRYRGELTWWIVPMSIREKIQENLRGE